MSARAAAAARMPKSTEPRSPDAQRATRSPPPPTPFMSGCSTPIAKAVVTAASTALPPRCSTSAPMRAPSRSCATTIPPVTLSTSWASTGRLIFMAAHSTRYTGVIQPRN